MASPRSPRGAGVDHRSTEKSMSLRWEGGKPPPTCADGAHGWRPDFGAGRGARVAARRDPRLARRANLDGLTTEEKPPHREDWKEVGHSTRSRSECVFSSFRQTFDGHVVAASGRTSSWRWPARSPSTTPCWRPRREPDGRGVGSEIEQPAVRGESRNAVHPNSTRHLYSARLTLITTAPLRSG